MPSTSGLAPGMPERLRMLLDTLRGLGYRATYTSGYRSISKQRALYDAWIKRGKRGLPAAPPGSSSHNYGLAVDVSSDAPDQVLKFAADVAGLVWFGPKDRVHFDPYGPSQWRAIARGLTGGSNPQTGD